AEHAPAGGTSVSSFGGPAGVKAGLSDLTVTVSAYIGKALGTALMLSGGEVGTVDPTKGKSSDGGYAQLMYKVGPKTNIGASWGFSRLKNTTAGDGNQHVISNNYAYTVGVYHQWPHSVKSVVEGSHEGTTGNTAGAILAGP